MEKRKSIIIRAIRHILDPLVRILLRFDISHSEFAEIAKRAYVDIAYKHFSLPKRKMTFSRVSVLTGLTRKEIVRLTKAEDNVIPKKTKGSVNRATLVIGGWLQDEMALDNNKQPKALPLKGEGASFETLVSRYSGDATARAVLDELVRVNAVEVQNDNKVKLLLHAYIPKTDEVEQLELVSKHTGDMMGTSIHNIISKKKDARFQREVVYTQVSEEIVKEFQKYSDRRSMELLKEFSQWLAEKSALDKKNNKKNNHNNDDGKENKKSKKIERVGVGIYFFKQNSED